MPSRILVTGAAGFIGSHTVDCLLDQGYTVIGVDNLRTGRMENLAGASGNSRFDFRQIDVTNVAVFRACVAEVRPEVAIHFAALVSVPASIADPVLNDQLNFQATRIVLDAARDFRMKRIVFASTASIYGDPGSSPVDEDCPKSPLSPYGDAKLASEKLLLGANAGMVVRCQRYFNVYGPRQDVTSPYSGVISIFLDHLQRNAAPMIFGDGEQVRDFISVHDVSRANALAAARPALASGVANICTGCPTSINELWRFMSRGHPRLPPVLHAPRREGDIRYSCGVPLAAERELGFRAQISLADGLAAMIPDSPSAQP